MGERFEKHSCASSTYPIHVRTEWYVLALFAREKRFLSVAEASPIKNYTIIIIMFTHIICYVNGMNKGIDT